MHSTEILTNAFSSITQKFELPSAPVAGITEEWLRQTLALRIQELIDSDFQTLLNILYRIDVSEQKVKEQLAANPVSEAPLIIAGLIIEREKQKAETRAKFRQQKP